MQTKIALIMYDALKYSRSVFDTSLIKAINMGDESAQVHGSEVLT